jgi:hypothetical protein
MLVIVRYLREPVMFATLKTRMSMAIYAIYIFGVKLTWAKNKNPAFTRSRIRKHLQKLALASLDGVVFRPLLDNLHSFFRMFASIYDTAAIFFVSQWTFRTMSFAFAQSAYGFYIFNCVHSLTPY